MNVLMLQEVHVIFFNFTNINLIIFLFKNQFMAFMMNVKGELM